MPDQVRHDEGRGGVGVKIELEDGTREEVTDIARLAELLRSLDPKTNSFAILSTADHDYVQTALVDGGYLIEKRLGAPDMHFEAAHLVPRPVETAARPWWKFWGEARKTTVSRWTR